MQKKYFALLQQIANNVGK